MSPKRWAILLIMMMLGSGGMHDFQYGNNIAAAAGAYTIAVMVNSVRTTFQVKLI